MPTYVIINLAEETDAGTGVTGKVHDALTEQGRKDISKFWQPANIVQQNTIYKYDLVDDFDTAKAGNSYGHSRNVIQDIALRVSDADAVFYCAHGNATDRDNVFTQRGAIGTSRTVLLSTVQQFVDFATLFLGTDKVHDLRLIVCFAARSATTDAIHTKNYLSSNRNNHAALKTSLAYKFYKGLHDQGVRTKTAARLGEVQLSMSSRFAMDILTQTEEGVLAGLELGALARQEDALGQHLTDMRQAELRYFVNNKGQEIAPPPDLTAPTGDAETAWFRAYKAATRARYEKDQHAMKTGKGRLTYEPHSSGLRIRFEGSKIYTGGFF